MKNKTIWFVIIIAIILVGFYVSKNKNSGEKSEGTAKIGVIAPLTGWGAYWGEGYVKGIELALSEIRASGGEVETVIEDGATDAAKSASAAQKLVNIDKVNALLVEFTGPTSSVSPIAKDNKIPLIYDALPRKFVDENPYAFKFYFDIGKQCQIATEYLAKQGYKNIGGVMINLDFAPECQSAMEKVAQEKGITTKVYKTNIDTTDFRTDIAKMKADKIDAIVPVFYEDNAISFFRQKSDLKFNVPVFMGIGNPDGLTEKVRSSVPASSIEGVIAYDQPIAEIFRAKLKQKYPDVTEKDYVAAAYAYDEMMYLWSGFSQCEPSDVNCIVDGIKADNHIGAVQSAGFGPDRILDMTPVYYKVTGGELVELSI